MRRQLIDLPGLQSVRQRQRYLSFNVAPGFTGSSGHGAIGIGEDFKPFHGHKHLCSLLQLQMAVSLL